MEPSDIRILGLTGGAREKMQPLFIQFAWIWKGDRKPDLLKKFNAVDR
jgi:5,10-methenyltetrahydromethanopterin hydrogenase